MLSPYVGDGSEEMELTESYKNPEIVSENLMHKYKFMEVRQAAAVLSASCSEEWGALCNYLSDFVLATDHLMQPGGNKSEVVKAWENFFYGDGWVETRVDTEQIVYKIPRVGKGGVPAAIGALTTEQRLKLQEKFPQIGIEATYQQGYLVDALRGRLAVDIEWNAKDGNLDRDIAAYRAWYELGLIDGAVLITKEQESCRQLVQSVWKTYLESLDQESFDRLKTVADGEIPPPVDLKTTTATCLEKASERIKRGDAGGCPVLIVGITSKCWDGADYQPEDFDALVEVIKKRAKKK